MHLECTPIWTNNPLPPLHVSLLVPDEVPNFNDIAGHVVVEDLDRLSDGDTSSEKLDHVAGFEDDVWVVCFARGPDGHGTVNQVECARDALVKGCE